MDAAFYFGWEAELIILIQSVLGPAGILAMSFMTLFGEETVLIILLGYLYWGRDKELGERLCVSLLTACTACPVIKNIFLRLRPYFVIDEIRCLDPAGNGDIYDVVLQGYSFPSAHTASAVAAYGTVAENSSNRIIRFVLTVLTAGVGVSRFSLGVHYPTDVIAGAVIGLIALAIGKLVSERADRGLTYCLLMLVCSPGLFICRTEDFFTCYGIMCGVLSGMLFERDHISFGSTDSILVTAARLLCGTAVFAFVVNILKIPVNLMAGSVNERALLWYRSFRYAAASFVTVGLCPYVFGHLDRIFRKTEQFG